MTEHKTTCRSNTSTSITSSVRRSISRLSVRCWYSRPPPLAPRIMDMGPFNPIVALAIAAIKMMLVVLFFMHVKYSTKLTKLTVGAGLFTFLVLVGMTLADYFTRAWGRW